MGRVVRHRATQLVAVGLLGLVLGGGIVALADRHHQHPRYGVGFDRPGHPGHPRFEERIPERRSERGPERGGSERGGSERGSERGPEWIPEREFER
ncbi:hypothetical protein [Saccharothrix sp. NRRL B-16314]|uniref:hypothetical protein n=1 Tax=Saccharothrix sp. NRRL B-16314 TaxID=1463825 RepID=UPI000AB0F825|nr:hypothetical protein [Saccharothrix sp. NRRL B-16314]